MFTLKTRNVSCPLKQIYLVANNSWAYLAPCAMFCCCSPKEEVPNGRFGLVLPVSFRDVIRNAFDWYANPTKTMRVGWFSWQKRWIWVPLTVLRSTCIHLLFLVSEGFRLNRSTVFCPRVFLNGIYNDWVDSDFSPFDVIHNRQGSVLDPLHVCPYAIVFQMELYINSLLIK